jgi:cytochrome c oxidase assembly protein subunit 15
MCGNLSDMSGHRYNPSLHWLALLTACCTFPLIFMGGLVTSHQAGMSVPDWPNSYGYNMFLFPPNRWLGGIFYEHTHRLMGTVVGFCSILLMLKAWGFGQKPSTRRTLRGGAVLGLTLALMVGLVVPLLSDAHGLRNAGIQSVTGFVAMAVVLACASVLKNPEPRGWVRWLTVAVLAMVIVQGVLGGLRVVLVQLDLAIVHACAAQAFFCLAAFASVVTSRWWMEAPNQPNSRDGRGLIVAAVAAAVIIYVQLIAGAVMRHYQAGLAVTDVPLVYGKLLPPATADDLMAINRARVYDMQLPMVTLGQIWIHFAHRIGAVVVTIFLIVVIAKALKLGRRDLNGLAGLLGLFLIAQITLGVLTVVKQKPADIASLHVAVGALTLMTTFVLAVRAMRLYSPSLLGRPEFKRVPADASRGAIPRAAVA